MFKLIKWSVIGAVTLGAAGLFVFGDHFGSYFSTISNSVRESVRGSIPVEFEIKRAEKLIRAIDPEIHDCKREVARAEVELEHLVREVARLGKTVAKQERKLKNGSSLLTDAKVSSFALSGRTPYCCVTKSTKCAAAAESRSPFRVRMPESIARTCWRSGRMPTRRPRVTAPDGCSGTMATPSPASTIRTTRSVLVASISTLSDKLCLRKASTTCVLPVEPRSYRING